LTSKAPQQGAFAGAIAGDQSDTVYTMDGNIEVLKQHTWREDTDVTHIYQGHDFCLWSRSVAEATCRHAIMADEADAERAQPDKDE
jgi:hypothetical protein